MLLKGSFNKTFDRNFDSGEVIFELITIDGFTVKCKGVCAYYAKGVPLELTGTMDESNKVFLADEIKECGSDVTLIKKYFMSSLFGKMSAPVASRLAILMDGDLFGFMEQPDAKDKIKLAVKKNDEWVEKIIAIVRDTTIQRQILELISPAGFNIADMSSIYKRYGDKSLKVMQENPYRLMSIKGISFAKCDMLAKSENFPADTLPRRKALLKTAMQSVYKSGSTRVTFKRLYSIIRYTMQHSAYEDLIISSLVFLDDILSERKYTVFEGYIYETWQYRQELMIANDIKRLSTTKNPVFVNDELISEIEESLHVTYDESQRKIFEAGQHGVSVLTGPPGSGKTSTILGFILAMQKINKEIKIMLSATTGCAARRLSDSTGIEAETVNRMLRPSQGEGEYTYNRYQQFEYDYIIIDEYSMADTKLTADFLSAVNSGTKIIFVGDCDQLKSVGPGNVLGDFIDSNALFVIRLNTIHRQDNASSLISDNAVRANCGVLPLVADYKTCGIYVTKSEEEALSTATTIFNTMLKQKPVESYNFLSLTKGGLIGTESMNKFVHEAIFHNQPCFQFGNYKFCKKERVMMLENNYDLCYFNGEMGTVTSYDSLGVSIELDHGEEIYLTGDTLYDFVPAYTKTVHKAQGSEAETIVMLLSNTIPVMLYREILYTGMTRAKKQLILISVGDAINTCVLNKNYRKRDTGLCSMLQS